MFKFLLAILLSCSGSLAFACQTTTVTGVDYGGAAYNCEAILQGYVSDCHPDGSMWVCSCEYSCNEGGTGPGTRVTRTTGVDYAGASSNCEAILQGRAVDCHPDGNMWVCMCYY